MSMEWQMVGDFQTFYKDKDSYLSYMYSDHKNQLL